jgi:hypothetical protein
VGKFVLEIFEGSSQDCLIRLEAHRKAARALASFRAPDGIGGIAGKAASSRNKS